MQPDFCQPNQTVIQNCPCFNIEQRTWLERNTQKRAILSLVCMVDWLPRLPNSERATQRLTLGISFS